MLRVVWHTSYVTVDYVNGSMVLSGNQLHITGNPNVSGATALSSTLDVTGNTTVGGTLDVTGDTTLSNASLSGHSMSRGTQHCRMRHSVGSSMSRGHNTVECVTQWDSRCHRGHNTVECVTQWDTLSMSRGTSTLSNDTRCGGHNTVASITNASITNASFSASSIDIGFTNGAHISLSASQTLLVSNASFCVSGSLTWGTDDITSLTSDDFVHITPLRIKSSSTENKILEVTESVTMDFDSHKHKTHLHVTSTGAITIRLPDLTTKYKHWIGKPITLEIDPSIEGSADLTVEYVAPKIWAQLH